MGKEFRVSLLKEQLIFSSAHFITFATGDGTVVCEQLHGHNYRVRCDVVGPLNEHGYVVDFIALRDKLKELVAALDHHVLLATQHPDIQIELGENEVEVKCQEKRWVFPREDCAVLSISNTTAELIAEYLADQLIDSDLLGQGMTELMVAVDENEGQWGECCVNLQ